MKGMKHERVKKEIAKCVVICACCHRVHHATNNTEVAQRLERPSDTREVGGSNPPLSTIDQTWRDSGLQNCSREFESHSGLQWVGWV